MNENYRNIVIEGNIGAGKTTMAKLLAEHLDARLILEEFENNPFLDQFYSDRERYSFQVELFFLAERYQQLSKILLGDIFHEHSIFDYHFVKSAIFSKVNLKSAEQALFDNLYQIMDRFMPRPDIIIFIHHSSDQLFKQISNRGRSYEDKIPLEYLEKINSSYFSFFKETTSYPIIVIDSSRTADASANAVFDKVKWALSENWPRGLSHIAL